MYIDGYRQLMQHDGCHQLVSAMISSTNGSALKVGLDDGRCPHLKKENPQPEFQNVNVSVKWMIRYQEICRKSDRRLDLSITVLFRLGS